MEIKKITPGDMSKFVAASYAVTLVEDGMNIGLGTGSTAYWFIVLLAQRVRAENLTVSCVATSSKTAELADIYGLPLTTLDQMLEPNLVVDGADEISPDLDLIKGGGGALLQEKIVANASDRLIIIADESKYTEKLGGFHLPVEVVKFGWKCTAENIREVLADSPVGSLRIELRKQGLVPYETDEGHYIIDCHCQSIDRPAMLSTRLNQIPGVVENGLFIGMADIVILGRPDGSVVVLDREMDKADVHHVGIPADIDVTFDV